ncbi:MAG: hypothetical protein KDA60_07255, partial [Planctomycetales bacterium]|nr:hypothetical protein [Planctomycetales bacterium]
VDCRIYMFQRAARLLDQLDCQFMVSGEVIGQRPNSQKRKHLETIGYQSGYEDLLLRPLSAKLLAPTRPEREGWVDRERLYRFYGRSRKGLIKLARELGLPTIPDPSTGCALTEQRFSHKVHDLMQHQPTADRWDYELLKTGRHYRLDEQHKVIVGRNQEENATLVFRQQVEHRSSSLLLEPDGFVGPAALLIGPQAGNLLDLAGGFLLRHTREQETATYCTRITEPGPYGTSRQHEIHHSAVAGSWPAITAGRQSIPSGDPTP